MEQMDTKKIHQLATAFSAFLLGIAGFWGLLAYNYNFESSQASRWSVSHFIQMVFIMFFASVLFSTSTMGYTKPLEWFGFLTTYKGAGAFIFFNGFLIIDDASAFGLVTGILLILYGTFSIAFGVLRPDEELDTYAPILKRDNMPATIDLAGPSADYSATSV